MGYWESCDEPHFLVGVTIAVSLGFIFYRTKLEAGPLGLPSLLMGVCVVFFSALLYPIESPISVTRIETYPWIERVRVTGQPNEFLRLAGILTLSTLIIYEAYQVFGSETPLIVGACILVAVVPLVIIDSLTTGPPSPISSTDGLDDDPPYYQ